MPTVDTTPETLRPYKFHGLELDDPKGGEALAECPFCSKPGKFSVNVESGQYRCWSCAEGTDKGGGNAVVFIRKLHELSLAATTAADYEELQHHRKLSYPETLIDWAVCRSITTGNWLVPGYGIDGKLNQLYQYIQYPDRMKLLPTPTLHHQLHGMNLWDADKPGAIICEGPWDGMKLYEVMRRAKDVDGVFHMTASVKASIYSQYNIISVPGCKTFFKHWLPLFAGREVRICYDNDHPGKNEKTGTRITPAGYDGVRYVTELLNTCEPLPTSISYLQWSGSYELDHAAALPGGFDLRDAFAGGL